MISEAYVFITLSGADAPVPAGRVALLDSNPPVVEFFYGRRYLERPGAIPLDPIHLPLKEGPVYENNLPMFGAIRDAAPDSWGRFIIEKRAGQTYLTEIDYLLASSGERVGALHFGTSPDHPLVPLDHLLVKPGDRSWLALGHLAAAIETLESGRSAFDDQLLELLAFGSSMGGARPKTVIEMDQALWLAKFNRRDDRVDLVQLEHATMRLAKSCGITVPETRVLHIGGRDILASRRFDRSYNRVRTLYRPTHFLSALTLTGRYELETARSSYQEIAQIIRQVGHDPRAMNDELFRRMVFNILVGNTDDHLRNHGFLLTDNGYTLAPAYDLVPMPQAGHTRYLALGVGLGGREATIDNALSDTAPFGLSQRAAGKIIADIRKTVKAWRSVFKTNGVSPADIASIKGCFVDA